MSENWSSQQWKPKETETETTRSAHSPQGASWERVEQEGGRKREGEMQAIEYCTLLRVW